MVNLASFKIDSLDCGNKMELCSIGGSVLVWWWSQYNSKLWYKDTYDIDV